MVASGASAIILGILVMALTPAYGFVVLGIMFGVDLVVTGLAFLLISLAAYQGINSLCHVQLFNSFYNFCEVFRVTLIYVLLKCFVVVVCFLEEIFFIIEVDSFTCV